MIGTFDPDHNSGFLGFRLEGNRDEGGFRSVHSGPGFLVSRYRFADGAGEEGSARGRFEAARRALRHSRKIGLDQHVEAERIGSIGLSRNVAFQAKIGIGFFDAILDLERFFRGVFHDVNGVIFPFADKLYPGSSSVGVDERGRAKGDEVPGYLGFRCGPEIILIDSQVDDEPLHFGAGFFLRHITGIDDMFLNPYEFFQRENAFPGYVVKTLHDHS